MQVVRYLRHHVCQLRMSDTMFAWYIRHFVALPYVCLPFLSLTYSCSPTFPAIYNRSLLFDSIVAWIMQQYCIGANFRGPVLLFSHDYARFVRSCRRRILRPSFLCWKLTIFGSFSVDQCQLLKTGLCIVRHVQLTKTRPNLFARTCCFYLLSSESLPKSRTLQPLVYAITYIVSILFHAATLHKVLAVYAAQSRNSLLASTGHLKAASWMRLIRTNAFDNLDDKTQGPLMLFFTNFLSFINSWMGRAALLLGGLLLRVDFC